LNNKIIIGIVVGLVIGLALGIFVSAFFNLSISKNEGVGTNDQVQVSGTVTFPQGVSNISTIYFLSFNGTLETTASVVDNHYSVLLIGGQSYLITNFRQSNSGVYSQYNPFYVPLGVTTFTENLVPSSSP
jgi:hypothetical protein